MYALTLHRVGTERPCSQAEPCLTFSLGRLWEEPTLPHSLRAKIILMAFLRVLGQVWAVWTGSQAFGQTETKVQAGKSRWMERTLSWPGL